MRQYTNDITHTHKKKHQCIHSVRTRLIHAFVRYWNEKKKTIATVSTGTVKVNEKCGKK